MSFFKNIFSKDRTKEVDLSKLGTEDILDYSKKIIFALGGADNIESVNYCSSRLRIILKTPKLDLEELKKLDIKSVIQLSDTNYHIVIGKEAKKLGDKIREILGV